MRKHAIAAAVTCGIMGVSLMACVPDLEKEPAAEIVQNGVEAIRGADHPENGLQDIAEEMSEFNELYAPTVKTLDDGRKVQEVPDSGAGHAFWAFPEPYNTYYLNAENRGCDSCHTDGLVDVLNNMTYRHWNIDNGLGTNINVLDCFTCHRESVGEVPVGANQFGSVIHGIHSKDSFNGDCMSCHAATTDGNGMQLWEESKYDAFAGIVKVENVQGDFTFDQNVIAGDNYEWTYYPGPDSASLDAAFKGTPNDVSEYDTWTISVIGLVDKPQEWTLSELIAAAPSETSISTMECEINGSGGEWIGNAEVKGIPISWFLDQVGVQPGATTITAHDPEGWGYGGPTAWGNGMSIEECVESGGMLIYEINGRPLTRMEGFPCRMWWPGHSISNSGKWVCEIEISDKDYHLNDGIADMGTEPTAGVMWYPDGETEATFNNKPTTGIMGTPEGLIIPVGESYTFEGYAYAMDEQVTSVEFSMDGGATWTKFDTSDSDKKKWVYWSFSLTPSDPGAYVLQVRATTDAGRISYQPDKVLVNAK